jgi:hypothetical protein
MRLDNMQRRGYSVDGVPPEGLKTHCRAIAILLPVPKKEGVSVENKGVSTFRRRNAKKRIPDHAG